MKASGHSASHVAQAQCGAGWPTVRIRYDQTLLAAGTDPRLSVLWGPGSWAGLPFLGSAHREKA